MLRAIAHMPIIATFWLLVLAVSASASEWSVVKATKQVAFSYASGEGRLP